MADELGQLEAHLAFATLEAPSAHAPPPLVVPLAVLAQGSVADLLCNETLDDDFDESESEATVCNDVGAEPPVDESCCFVPIPAFSAQAATMAEASNEE